MTSLDKYNEAAELGILGDDKESAISALEAEKRGYENQVNSLTESINSSNRKIASWRTQKNGASKSTKQTLSKQISAEQEKITATRAQIARIKKKISAVKSLISEYSSYKPASYYINQGVSDTKNYYSDLISAEKSDFDIWFRENKETATPEGYLSQYHDRISNKIELQSAFVDDLYAAYEKMSEIYGESSAESVNLLENLKKEEAELLSLEDTYESITNAVNEFIEVKTRENELNIENAQLKNKLWNYTEGEDALSFEKRAENIKNLNIQLENQGVIVEETAKLYRELVKQYGINAEESKNLENQLLSECAAYEKLSLEIQELYAVEEYGRKEREDVVFGLNDFLKNNKEFLLSTGMSEEEIYEVARKVSGFDDLVNYTNNHPVATDVTSSHEIIGSILNELLKESFGELPESFFESGINFSGMENIFDDFGTFLQSITSISELFDVIDFLKDLYASSGNSYNSTYNFSLSGESGIADQIYEVKKYDAMKKARGIE